MKKDSAQDNRYFAKLSIKAFTLVELMVVMAIIGILATLIVGGFRSSQLRGRDAQRKSDLKQLANALELFWADYGKYPAASSGKIAACSYNRSTGVGSPCDWGDTTDSFSDTRPVTYMNIIPKDPSKSLYYWYVVSASGDKFQLFARLENTQDKSIVAGLSQLCGTSTNCNFAVTSTNAKATDSI